MLQIPFLVSVRLSLCLSVCVLDDTTYAQSLLLSMLTSAVMVLIDSILDYVDVLFIIECDVVHDVKTKSATVSVSSVIS